MLKEHYHWTLTMSKIWAFILMSIIWTRKQIRHYKIVIFEVEKKKIKVSITFAALQMCNTESKIKDLNYTVIGTVILN